MAGDGRTRRCRVCDRNVYNLADLSGGEAARIVSEGEGRRSTQLFRRHDGTVLGADCPWGLRRRRVRRAVALAAASALATAFATALDPMPTPPGSRHAHEAPNDARDEMPAPTTDCD